MRPVGRRTTKLVHKEVQLAEQSSSAVLFRALVMLSCLIAIPLAAVFGKSLPEMLKNLVNGCWSGPSASVSSTTDEAPRFQPVAAGSVVGTPRANPGLPTHGGPLTASAAGYTGPAGKGFEAVAAGYEQPLKAPAPSVSPAALAAEPVSAPPDRFAYVQNRLRDLGAGYRSLESWGEQQQLYRFHCRMPVAGDPTCTYYFEATDVNPLKAMSDVLEQVENWHRRRK